MLLQCTRCPPTCACLAGEHGLQQHPGGHQQLPRRESPWVPAPSLLCHCHTTNAHAPTDFHRGLKPRIYDPPFFSAQACIHDQHGTHPNHSLSKARLASSMTTKPPDPFPATGYRGEGAGVPELLPLGLLPLQVRLRAAHQPPGPHGLLQ
jgi:hypothetical protein